MEQEMERDIKYGTHYKKKCINVVKNKKLLQYCG